MNEEIVIVKIFHPGKKEADKFGGKAFVLKEDLRAILRETGINKGVSVVAIEKTDLTDEASCSIPYIEIQYSDTLLFNKVVGILKQMKVGMRIFYFQMTGCIPAGEMI